MFDSDRQRLVTTDFEKVEPRTRWFKVGGAHCCPPDRNYRLPARTTSSDCRLVPVEDGQDRWFDGSKTEGGALPEPSSSLVEPINVGSNSWCTASWLTVTRAHPPDTVSELHELCSSLVVVSWWWLPPFVPDMYCKVVARGCYMIDHVDVGRGCRRSAYLSASLLSVARRALRCDRRALRCRRWSGTVRRRPGIVATRLLRGWVGVDHHEDRRGEMRYGRWVRGSFTV